MEQLTSIFNPKSVAVIGASQKLGSVGNQVVANLLAGKFEGQIFPINPTAPDVLGVKAYKSILDVPADKIDLAVYTVPEKFVISCAKEAARKNVQGHVVITSGFSEVGNHAGEDELTRICRESGGRLIGPNIIGLLLNSAKANASFCPFLPYPGKTAMVSQSGSLLIALDGVTYIRKFGCSSMISLGNMADLDFADTINFYAQDKDTCAIALYIEGIKAGTGRAFIEAGRKAGKPIIALKAGVSAHGAAAAASHTGSLAGAVKIYDAAFNQANIVHAMDLDEMLDSSRALACQPPMLGDNIVVITNGGGIGVLSTDSAEAHGIPLKTAPKDLQEKFYKCMPSYGSPKNPVDITGGSGAQGYTDALNVALESDWVSGVAILYCEVAVTKAQDVADAVMRSVHAHPNNKKPIVGCFVGGQDSVDACFEMGKHNIPIYDNPKKTMCALAALRQYAKFQARGTVDDFRPFAGTEHAKDKALEIIRACRASGRNALTEIEAEHLFQAYGIPVAKAEIAKDAEEAVKLATEIGFPVVMKIVSPQILHKSDAGGVKVGVKDAAAVREAFATIVSNAHAYRADAQIHGVLVCEMAPRGREVIIGSVNDGTFGPTVMFGMGGIFVEVLKDVTFRVAPFSPATANEMIPEIKSFPILAGTRGEKPADIAALAELTSRMSQVVYDLRDEVAETDANPVMVYNQGQGIKVVDARIILKSHEAAAPAPAHH
eukprot:m51a1_g3454 acetyl-CoA synthetase (718) ;mRNA; r:683478-685943